MALVLVALLPAVLTYALVLSPAILLQMGLCAATAVAAEALMLRIRKRNVIETLKDNSALVCGFLLAFAIPPFAPFWVAIIGTAVAIILGKHLYGGLGHNPFNPAMVGYAVLIISFPVEMTLWQVPALATADNAPGLIDSFRLVFSSDSLNLAAPQWDAVTSATPLDRLKLAPESTELLKGVIGAYAWEWLNLAWLAGGIWMLWRGIISWHIPVFFCIGLALPYSAGSLLGYSAFAGESLGMFATPLFGLFSGGAMLGAFFIATDPVSAATTPLGRVVYAFAIGLLTFTIREFSSYPEGIAFAVLLMNLSAPLIDQCCGATGVNWRFLR